MCRLSRCRWLSRWCARHGCGVSRRVRWGRGGLRGFGKRQRIVGVRVEEVYDVGALFLIVDPRERHQRAWDITAGVLQPSIKRSEGPRAALCLQRCRVVEASKGGDRASDHAVKIRADIAGLALLEG